MPVGEIQLWSGNMFELVLWEMHKKLVGKCLIRKWILNEIDSKQGLQYLSLVIASMIYQTESHWLTTNHSIADVGWTLYIALEVMQTNWLIISLHFLVWKLIGSIEGEPIDRNTHNAKIVVQLEYWFNRAVNQLISQTEYFTEINHFTVVDYWKLQDWGGRGGCEPID